MQVKQALTKYIQVKAQKGEVIHLIKTKHQVGKVKMTIGKSSGTGHQYAIWEYTKTCKCGQVAYSSNNVCRLAEYLIELCGRDHLKRELPLHNYT